MSDEHPQDAGSQPEAKDDEAEDHFNHLLEGDRKQLREVFGEGWRECVTPKGATKLMSTLAEARAKRPEPIETGDECPATATSEVGDIAGEEVTKTIAEGTVREEVFKTIVCPECGSESWASKSVRSLTGVVDAAAAGQMGGEIP